MCCQEAYYLAYDLGLLSHKWITDFMCNSPLEYVEELVYCLQDVWQAVSRSGPLELKLLTAACWLKAQKDKAVLDCEDALTSNMVAFCLQSTYGLVGVAFTLQVHVHKSQSCPGITLC